MNKEIWEKWEPLAGISKVEYLCKIYDDQNKVELFLSNSDSNTPEIKVIFDAKKVFGYRFHDESNRLLIPDSFGIGNWTFFKVLNSEFVSEFGLEGQLNAHHLCFVTADDFIDILSVNMPRVEFL